jgi:ferredoxin
MAEIARVWIDEGCILCHACAGLLPDVFHLPAGEGAVILGDVRVDGRTSRNAEERSALNAVGLEWQDDLREAVAGCPIEIIHVDEGAP